MCRPACGRAVEREAQRNGGRDVAGVTGVDELRQQRRVDEAVAATRGDQRSGDEAGHIGADRNGVAHVGVEPRELAAELEARETAMAVEQALLRSGDRLLRRAERTVAVHVRRAGGAEAVERRARAAVAEGTHAPLQRRRGGGADVSAGFAGALAAGSVSRSTSSVSAGTIAIPTAGGTKLCRRRSPCRARARSTAATRVP